MRTRPRFHGLADPGRARDHQEDNFGSWVPQDSTLFAEKGALFIVADGVGGHNAGEIASDLAVRIISEVYSETSFARVEDGLRNAVQVANSRISQRAQEDIQMRRMATTVVCAVVRGANLFLAHVGDSRAYLYRGGELELLTNDHSWVAEQVRTGVLTPEAAETHPRRHVITRSLGYQPAVDVEITGPIVLHSGDRILLCTDGLYEEVPKSVISAEMEASLEDSCSGLVARANEAGGEDNITVIVIEVGSLEGFDRESTQPRQVYAVDDEETGTRPVYNPGFSAPLGHAFDAAETLAKQLVTQIATVQQTAQQGWSELRAEIARLEKKASTPQPCRPESWAFTAQYDSSQRPAESFVEEFNVTLPSSRAVSCGVGRPSLESSGGKMLPSAFLFWLIERDQGKLDGRAGLLVSHGRLSADQQGVLAQIQKQRLTSCLAVTGPGIGMRLSTENVHALLWVTDVSYVSGGLRGKSANTHFGRLFVEIQIESRE